MIELLTDWVIWLALLGAVLGLVYLWPTPMARVAQAYERHRGNLKSKTEVVNGNCWHYLEGGCGEPLVLLHGFNGDSDHFTRSARYLTQHFRILVPDLPGFGETQTQPNISHRIEDVAQLLLEWLDYHQIEEFYLGGNSMGGYISMAMAQKAPHRVRALWLLAPGGVRSAPLSPVLQEVSEDRHNPLVIRNYQDFERLLDYCFVNRPWMPKPLLRFLSKRASATCQSSLRIFDAMLNDSAPLETMATGLSTPALIVWGEEDRVLDSAGAEIIGGLMDHPRIILMPKIGHLPMIEAPRESAEAWLSFTENLVRHPENDPKPDR